MNRYVGLRYVNKFFDDGNGGCEWNNTIAFEALTTVTHLGNSYISKQAVPIGIDISNTIYWTKTNDYDAQLNNYKTSTNEEISNTNTNIGTLNLLETTNKTNIVAAINEQNTALMENTNRIKDIYINVKGLGFLAKGDGISDDTQAIQTAINALSDSGGTIYIPRGTYITSSDLIFENKNKITIRGEFIHHGYDSNSSMLSIIKSNANNGYIINLRKAKNIKCYL
jgi:hypothetical protein